MTRTIQPTRSPPEAATGSDPLPNSPDILMNLIVALLAPMFLGVSTGDVALARMAAIETVNAYRTRNHADLIAVAQIIAFGLAALGSLSLSMADDIRVSMALRLRGNGNNPRPQCGGGQVPDVRMSEPNDDRGGLSPLVAG